MTVKDTTANHGYTLSAKLSQNTLPNATITMASNSSGTCTLASPCTLNTTTRNILTTTTNTATGVTGETTQWTVRITIPANITLGNYLLDIEYNEAPTPPPPTDPGTTLGSMQSLTNANCPTTRGTAFDARNNQIYYVEKIGSLCWMETNLRYSGGGNHNSSWGWPDDRKSLTAGTSNSYTAPYYYNPPGGSTDYTNTAAEGGFYGYLYNWCAAMGGQANACNDTSTSGFDTTISVCPAGWRLPIGNGGDFTTLNNIVNSGATNTDAGLRSNFLAVYSGEYDGSLVHWGSNGYVWSSTVFLSSGAYFLRYLSAGVAPTPIVNRHYGFAVRCVLD